MKKYSNDLILKRYNQKKMTFRKLSQLTKEIDLDGKGVCAATVKRVIDGFEASPSNLCLICEALGISPSSTYVDLES